jgi:hypothetical protein
MFNKNDPLIGAVSGVMKENELRRQVEQKLCEELGIYSRKALPHEHRANYDALLEQRLDELSKGKLVNYIGSASADKSSAAHDIGKINQIASDYGTTKKDRKDRDKLNKRHSNRSLGIVRAASKLAKEEVEQIDELSKDKLSKYLSANERSRENIAGSLGIQKPGKSPDKKKSMKEALHPNQQKLDVHEPEKDELTKKDFEMLRAKKTMKEEEQLDEISRDLARRFIRKASDEKKSGSIKKDRTKGVELAGKKAYSIPSKPKVRATDEYSKMREKMVGKGTDRETTRKLVGESDDWFFGKKKKNNDSVTDMERPAKNKTSGYTYRHKTSGKEISKDTKGKPSSEWKRLKEEEQLEEARSKKMIAALDKYMTAYRSAKASGDKEAVVSSLENARKANPNSRNIKQQLARLKAMKIEEDVELNEAAKSKSQQRIMGMALAMRRGESDRGSSKVAKIAADMPEKELEKFAKTKRKGLPDKVKKMDENLSIDDVMEEIARNLGEAKMKQIAEQKPSTTPSMQTNRPSIRAGLNRAGLRTQGGVVGGATPADRAREPTAAPEASSFAPKNVQAQAVQNRAKADERDAGEMAPAAAARPATTPATSAPATTTSPPPLEPKRVPTTSVRGSDVRQTQLGSTPRVPSNLSRPDATASTPPAPTTPASPSRPAAPARSTASIPTPPPRPATLTPAPEPKSRQMFQAAQDSGDDSAASFFAADRQLQKERGLRESLEYTIRKMDKND